MCLFGKVSSRLKVITRLIVTMGVVMWMDDECETAVKWNDDDRWNSDGVVLWLERRQNKDAVEWWEEWPKLRWFFYSSVGWESSDLRRIAYSDGADSMLQFQFDRGGDGTKHCWKIKPRQWACLDSMGRKRDMARCRDDVNRRRGGTEKGKERRRHQLDWREFY
jgi:hypothetical protein